MKYVIAGKSDSYHIFIRENNYSPGKDIIYARTENKFNEIKEDDTIILLSGWWSKSWAKDALNNR